MGDFGERLKETAKILAPALLAASFVFPPAAAITIPLTTINCFDSKQKKSAINCY